MVIGITGGSGTGKSSLARLLGYDVIDVDKVYHELLETDNALQAELIDAFGTCERKGMASIVFADKEKLQKLNSITFKYILSAIESRLSGNAVIDATVLFESGMNAKCDVTIAVIARRDFRIKRIMERDGLTIKQAETRVDAQKSDEFYVKSADHIIHTNGNDLTHAAKILKEKITPVSAIYGGTFDPPTLGHLDVIRRASAMYNKVYAVVLVNEAKKPVFSTEERVGMLKTITEELPNVVIESYNGLLAEYAYNKNVRYSVRGVRNGFDTEYERPMFEFNAQIAQDEYGHELDTIFIPTTRENFDTSSSNVRRLLAGKAYKVARKYLDGRIAEQVIAKYQ